MASSTLHRGTVGALPLVALVAASLPLAYLASPLPALSRPRLLLLVLSLILFLALLQLRGGRRDALLWATRLYLALGVGYTLAAGRFPPNELAGVLALFLPLAAALAVTPVDGDARARWWRLEAALLAVYFAGELALTASRSGLFAAGIATVGALLLAGRRGRTVLTAGVIAATVAVVWIGVNPVLELLVFDHKIEGLTFDSWLTGRPHIWGQALYALADSPVFGLGLGASGPAIEQLYPYWRFAPGTVVEDAHNLFLQTALDLGVPGALTWLALLVLAAVRWTAAWRRTPGLGLARCYLLGLGGSFVAFLLYGTVDAVALGTPGSVASWFLLGLIFAAAPRREERGTPALWGALAAGALLVVALPAGRDLLRLNRAASLAARAVLAEPARLPAAETALLHVEARLCRAAWLRSRVASIQGATAERDAAWEALLRCTPAYLDMTSFVAPDNRRLAEFAVAEHADDPRAWLWLARAVRRTTGDTADAVRLYRQSLALAPGDAVVWRELGDTLSFIDPAAAIAAYAESCRRGDPIAHSCWNAGRLAEERGDPEAAIRYYRQSRADYVRRRADVLERQQRSGGGRGEVSE